MRKSICSIVLCVLAAPAAAQPGTAPPQPPPYPPQPQQQPAPYPPQPQQQPAPYPPPYPPAQPQQPYPPAQPQQPYPQEPPPYPAQPPPYPAQPQQPYPPQAQPQPTYPATGPTRATFVSTGEARWDVRLDNDAVCTTPCSIAIDPMRYVTLHSQDRAPTRLAVGHLPAGDVLVQAKPRAQGAFAAGVTFTSLSGMGLATGITLTAVGCSTDRDAMCKAGLITGAASGIALYLSIDLLRSALPRVHIGPAQAAPYATGSTVGLAGRF